MNNPGETSGTVRNNENVDSKPGEMSQNLTYDKFPEKTECNKKLCCQWKQKKLAKKSLKITIILINAKKKIKTNTRNGQYQNL